MTSTSAERKDRVFAAGAIAVYVLLRMAADPILWRKISDYYSYAFEAIFGFAVYWYFRRDVQILKKISPRQAAFAGGAFILGALIFRLAGFWGIVVPFDFSSGETVFLLLALGPILEEAIFRLALWQATEVLFSNSDVTLALTTVLFAAGHFVAYFYVPEQYQSFVVYQTVYVVLLGALSGWQRLKSGALVMPVLVHLAFNFGFYCAWKIT